MAISKDTASNARNTAISAARSILPHGMRIHEESGKPTYIKASVYVSDDKQFTVVSARCFIEEENGEEFETVGVFNWNDYPESVVVE